MRMDHLIPVLLAGNDKLISSIAICLQQAGHPVVIFTPEPNLIKEQIHLHVKDMELHDYEVRQHPAFQVTDALSDNIEAGLAIVVTHEDLSEKKDILRRVTRKVFSDTIVMINTESIPLHTLQDDCICPDRILGANWTEPAHTTFFLELIVNQTVQQKCTDKILSLATSYWKKDPYVVTGESSIRSRLIAALAREAFYLVQNGYATIEDIDRACRNDPGYYMPFCGYFRYMDLMGTYAYGMVMRELNPDLSKEVESPAFFNKMIESGAEGMKNHKGFYQYSEKEMKDWNILFREFNYRIHEIMKRYPFNHDKQDILPENLHISNQHG